MTDPATNDASRNDRLDEILVGYLDFERSGQRLAVIVELAGLLLIRRAFSPDGTRVASASRVDLKFQRRIPIPKLTIRQLKK